MPHCPECAASVANAETHCSTCGAALLTSRTESASQPNRPSPSDDARLRQELSDSLAPRYELLKPLGSGGMGAVFLAREPALKRLVAVKVLSPHFVAEASAYARFAREARAVAALSHPNVVSVYAVGETAGLGLPYIVMQYVDGPPLSAWIREHGPAGEPAARRILGGVAAALAAAHARGLVHRDVKPANILLESTSNRVLVADFGLAAAVSSEGRGADDTALTATGWIMGTPVYMSPEQATAQPLTDKSDVYSLGIVAYELLTGELPFAATSAMAWVAAHLRDTPLPIGQRRADLSPEVAQLVDRCLSKSESARPTAREFAEVVLPSLEAELPWPPPGLLHLLGRGRLLARSAQLTALGALLLLLTVVAPPRQVNGEGAWWSDFGTPSPVAGSSLGVRREAVDSSAAGIPRWWLPALALGLGAAVAGFIWLGVLSYPTLRSISRHRKIGWHWSTLSDVLADPDGRSGLLLTGSREIAAIEADRRAKIRQARRRMTWIRVLGGVWVLAVGGGLALLTAFGVLDVDRAGQTAVVGLWSLLVASYVVALGVALWAVLEEARLFGAIPRRRTHTVTYAAGHPESSQDVAAWYAALPGEQRSASSRLSPGTLNAGFLLGILFGSAGLLALGLMSAAAVVAARRARELGPETAEAAELLEAKIGASSGQTREAWSPYLPPREDISDSGARRLVRSLIETERAPGAAPSYPVDPTEVVARLAPDTLGHGVAAAFRTVSRELPADTARLLSILSQHPRTALLRRIARAPAADIFGSALDRPIGTYGTLDRLASPPYGAFRTAAHANVLSALLATRRRDWDTAALRLGENVAIAEHFLKAPSVFANRYGVGMLQQLALLPLAEVELARGNRDQAQTLVTAGDQVREEVLGRAWPGRLAGLAADPHDLSRFSAALRSDRLSPGYRVESFSGGWAGFCLNRWEILSGLSRLREPAVLRIGESMTDVPHAGELARLTAGMWERESGAVLGDVIGRLRWCWGISR